MKTVYTPRHQGHSGHMELTGGAIVPAFEKPSRAEYVIDRVKAVNLGDIIAPEEFSLKTAAKVHRKDYLAFLPTVWDRWKAAGRSGCALPSFVPSHGMRFDRKPDTLDGQLGFYSIDAGCSFVEGTWDAIKSSHDVALTAAKLVAKGQEAAFALCRPPGHHSGAGYMGGYCFINNAAVAAQWFLDKGAKRVSILDVDYHHGNGTQDIFYERSDVQVINFHAEPACDYPYFVGFKDEKGAHKGEGYNLNYPMPAGTKFDVWSQALDHGCKKLAKYKPDVVIVSLGVDTFEKDPISQFKLKTKDYPYIGKRIAKLGLPTLFVMEGGYAVEEIGVNAVGVLTGFEGR